MSNSLNTYRGRHRASDAGPGRMVYATPIHRHSVLVFEGNSFTAHRVERTEGGPVSHDLDEARAAYRPHVRPIRVGDRPAITRVRPRRNDYGGRA